MIENHEQQTAIKPIIKQLTRKLKININFIDNIDLHRVLVISIFLHDLIKCYVQFNKCIM